MQEQGLIYFNRNPEGRKKFKSKLYLPSVSIAMVV